jgi:hypothetical protein
VPIRGENWGMEKLEIASVVTGKQIAVLEQRPEGVYVASGDETVIRRYRLDQLRTLDEVEQYLRVTASRLSLRRNEG